MSKKKEFKFRLSEKETEKAQRDAEKYEMTINALAKFLVTNLSLPENPEQRLLAKKTLDQVSGIGNNVNQIAKKVNSQNSFSAHERQMIISALNEIRNNTRELLGREPVEEIEIKTPVRKFTV